MANNQQVRVDLQFKGDMSDVEKKLQQLQNTLSGITSGKTIKGMAFTSDINKAVGDTTKLQAILKNTTMANGNLDLTKFRSELQKSGMTVKELGNSLLSLGPQGSQAFSQLTQSIINAEVPLKRTSTLLSNFATTLKNTAKWQISSSILHGFMSSVSSAYNYAQDLNESLNNIRIVSKQNTDQMAEFAQEANKAAKELSVTTTAYTDAALIFYQQGLQGDAVTERTDVVAKMSNVTRDSVDKVSSYMTAIWNNFDDGSESLEHYADVITGLGAATASSSAEMAAGLEKFAAVADTVGLSYDYATSALATVVAQTRQSADTVGTAFKTLFARIEGLKLGETLEDGVDLNKYSQALAKIGVSVLDANGQLRDMDSILDDMGAKWGQINKAQQVALAQTVAGTRQYNQLVALMDNWDKVQDNLQTARSSNGELQKQADIYAESWEAAQKRVRAAWESIYSSLFDDKFFIKLTNGLGSFVEGIDKVVKSLGGLKGILPLLSAGLLNLFNKDIANGINNFVYNLQIGTKKTQNSLINIKEQFVDVFKNMTSSDSLSSTATVDVMSNQASYQQALLNKQRELNAAGEDFDEIQKIINKSYMERIDLTGKESIESAKKTEELQRQLDIIQKQAESVLKGVGNTILTPQQVQDRQSHISNEVNKVEQQYQSGLISKEKLDELTEATKRSQEALSNYVTQDDLNRVQKLQESYGLLITAYEDFLNVGETVNDEQAKQYLQSLIDTVQELGGEFELNEAEIQDFFAAFEQYDPTASIQEQTLSYSKMGGAIEELGQKAYKYFDDIIERLVKSGQISEDDTEKIKTLNDAFELYRKNSEQRVEHSKNVFNNRAATQAGLEQLNSLDQPKFQKMDFGQTFTDATRAAMSFGSALNSINGLLDTLNNKEASFGDKMLAILTNGSMAAMMLGNSFKTINSIVSSFSTNISAALNAEVILRTNNIAALQKEIAILEKQKISKQGKAELIAIENQLIKKQEALQAEQLLLDKAQTTEGQKQVTSKTILTALEKGEIGFLQAIFLTEQLTTAEEKAQTIEEIKQLVLDAIKEKGLKARLALHIAIKAITSSTGLIITATLGSILLIVAALKHQKKEHEEIVKLAKEQAQEHQKITDSLKEENDKVNKLKDSYSDLYAGYKDNSILKDEMLQRTLALAGEYDNERIALLALGEAYDEINNEINQETGKKNVELINSTQQDVDNYSNAISKQINDTSIFTGNDKVREALKEKGLINTTTYENENGEYSFDTFDIEEFTKQLAAGDEELQKILSDFADDSWVKKLKSSLEEVKDEVDNLQSSFENLKEISLDEAFRETFNPQEVKNDLEKYRKALEEFKNNDYAKKSGMSDSELEEYFNKQVSTYQESGSVAATITLAKVLLDENATEEELDKLENYLIKFSDSDRAFIYLHPQLAGDTEEEIAEFMNRTKATRDYQEQANISNTANAILSSYGENGQLKDEELETIQNDLGISVAGRSNSEIIEDVRNLYNKATELANEYYKNASQEAKQYAAEIENEYNQISTKLNSTGRSIRADASDQEYDTAITNEIKSSFEEARSSEDSGDFKSFINENFGEVINDAGEQIEFLTEKYKILLAKQADGQELSEQEVKLFSLLNGKIEDNAGQIQKAAKNHANYGKASKEVTTIVKNVVEITKDYKSEIESIKQEIEELNGEIDNLQAAYKTMDSAQKEYAENGWLSVDSVQALVKLGPQYLKALSIEDGQLKINTESLQEEMLAEYDLMEAKEADLLQTQLKTLLDSEASETEKEKIAALYVDAAAQSAVNGTLEQFIVDAGNAITKAGQYSDAVKGMINYATSLLGVINAGRDGVNKNFPKAMGVSSKGGGSKKEKEKKDLKEYADEFDRFYPFQKVIDDLADAISDLAKEQEHLAGGELVGSIRYQNKLLQEQKKAYQELAKEQKKYQKEMQADLAKYGMSFDTASGNIVNYAQSTQAMLDQYNAAIEKYNKSAQSDADKKALEAVEKEYEKFKKLVSNYQGILTEIQDTENNLDDIYYETIANNLKEFEIMLQVKLDIGEAQRMVNDFISKINKNFKTLRKSTEEWMEMFDTALKNAHTYINGDLGTINVDLDAVNKVKNAIDSGDYGHEGAMFASESEAITKYKELVEQLKEDANDLYELYKQAWEDYLDAIDESIEAWEEVISNFDDVNDTLDHYEKIIELLHNHQDTDQGFEELMALYNQQMALQLAKQATLRKQIETMQQEYDELIAAGAKENDKDVKAIKDAINAANKELQGSIEAYLETINKAFDKQVEKLGKDRMKAALGFDPDQFTESWDRAKKAQEGYYDNNERIYQLDRINRKFNEAIDETKDIKLQKQLIKLRDEENKRLEEKKILSEADVAIAEKKLAVEQARIALEEAQNNKSQMRLQRDSQGNWNYQFVADEDNIAEKQQALMDASNDLYETTKQAAEDCVNRLRELFTSWSEEYNAIMTDASLNDEQRMLKLQELDTYYTGLINQNTVSLNSYKTELGEATANLLLSSYEVDKDNYSNMTEEQKAITDSLKEHNIQDIADIATANDEEYSKIQQKVEEVNEIAIKWWNNLKDTVQIDARQMEEANNELYTKLQQLIEEYDEAIRRSEEASGIAWSNVREAIDETGRSIDEVSDKVDECVDRTQALSDFRERVMEIEQAWLSVKDSIEDALSSLRSYLEKLLEVKEMQDVVKQNETPAGSYNGPGVGDGGNSGNGSSSGSSNNGKTGASQNNYVADFSVTKVKENGNGYSIWRGTPISTSGNRGTPIEKEFSNTYSASEIRSRFNSTYGGRPCSYDTGGYTGSWSDIINNPSLSNNERTGKLAFLHQKELVLNQADTKNILDAVQLVRDMNSSNNEFAGYLAEVISQSASSLAQILASGIDILGERMAYTSDRVANALLDAGSRQLDQNVHIEASFPNVRDRNEIEEAFDNLINIASQRAGRNNGVGLTLF